LQLPGFEPTVDSDSVAQFLARGFLPGDRSWLRGVELVPEGTVLTWDLETGGSTRTRYWSWDDIGNTTIPGDRRELVEEWGRLFVDSVEKRCRQGRIGVHLSGGLDSRAILAAVPETVTPLHALTFGFRNATDVRIAEKAARVRGAVHHVQEITEHNWLAPRFEGVWWSEGQINLIDNHGIGGFDERQQWFDINISGFAGDLTMGGSYIRKGVDEIDAIRNRVRRFTSVGLKMPTSYLENRIPFFDNELLEFTLSIPQSMRAREHVYADMLLTHFPELFKNIPWQETGVPITWPLSLATLFKRGRSVVDRTLHRVGVGHGHRSFADYDAWLRRDPARSLIGGILQSKDALYPEYVSRDTVLRVWEELQGGAARGREAGLYATLEIWLQQMFNARYRTAPKTNATP
jgi:asparagine synthase (glutamine-hydrolysing)